MPRKPPEFTVVIDSREQLPYKFPLSVAAKLDAGDYSLQGMERRVAVERKTKEDAYGTFGGGRKRFERELLKLTELDYAAIVIESSLSELCVPPPFVQRMTGAAVVQSLLSWSIKYGVHVWFADTRRRANSLTYSLLEKFWRYNAPDVQKG